MRNKIITTLGLLALAGIIACSAPMTTREGGAVIGTVGGAAVGGIVGSAVGHPGAGAAVGGVVGLGGGALIGDQIQALQNRQAELDKQLKASQEELENQRKELERLKKESREY
jgi:outer membrane lipoprotein SlyB